MTKVVVWANTTNRTAPTLANGGASIPQNYSHRPKNTDRLDDWFAAGWHIDSVGGIVQARAGDRSLVEEITVLVLAHQ